MDEGFQVIYREIGIFLDANLFLHVLNNLFKRINVRFAVWFHSQYDIAIHLNETAVGVPGETRISRLQGNPFHGYVVESQVQDGVHHTGHRSPCS